MHRIRHFDTLSNVCRATALASAREALGPIGSDDGCVDEDAPKANVSATI